jgi:hypothetical protein
MRGRLEYHELTSVCEYVQCAHMCVHVSMAESPLMCSCGDLLGPL